MYISTIVYFFQPYGQEYIKGTLAYQENNFDMTITYMEKSLKLFYEEYEKCRFLCENPFDQGWFPDFVSSIASEWCPVLSLWLDRSTIFPHVAMTL